MLLSKNDKATAKRTILGVVEPRIVELGFRGMEPRGHVMTTQSGSTWCLLLQCPADEAYFRVTANLVPAAGELVYGPTSDPYRAPDHPGDIRYKFGFDASPKTHSRCASELLHWIENVAMPWSHSQPTSNWRNPTVVARS